MILHSEENAAVANEKAADLLASWLLEPKFRSLMVAAGNTPLNLYALIAAKGHRFPNLSVFMLDEYLGVPPEEPRNCANLLRKSVVEAWKIPEERYFTVSSVENEALESIRRHEQRIAEAGGLDGIVLGLGQNGHLGFNEPGSAADSAGRIVPLERISVEANRKWFDGKYAPNKGVTVGMRTILGAHKVLILAYGSHKRSAVQAMVQGGIGPECPASFLQGHPNVHFFLESAAAAGLSS